MIVAIIPARGGSKGIPRKNVIDLCGKPLIAWSIEQAIEADSVDRVIVATDDDEIAKVAEDYGAIYFGRSRATATDEASSELALIEVLENLGETPELIVFLQATSPIRQPGDIDAAIWRCVDGNFDSCFSGREVHGFTWGEFSAGLVAHYRERIRRQDRESRTIEENGSIYVFKPWVLTQGGKRLGGRIGCYEMHALDSFQVDSLSDLAMIADLLPSRLRHAMHHA